MGLHGDIKKWLRGQAVKVALTIFEKGTEKSIYAIKDGQHIVHVVDLMTKMRGLMNGELVTLSGWCKGVWEKVIYPLMSKYGTKRIVICTDNQRGIETHTLSKLNTQRNRSEAEEVIEPYPEGTVLSDEWKLHCDRLFVTRWLRYSAFTALRQWYDTNIRSLDSQDVEVEFDFCDGQNGHTFTEADSTLCKYARDYGMDPNAVVILHTIDTDLIPMLLHWVETYGIQATLRWPHWMGDWVRVNVLYAMLKGIFHTATLFNVLCLVCGTDHTECGLLTPILPVTSRTGMIFEFAVRYARELARAPLPVQLHVLTKGLSALYLEQKVIPKLDGTAKAGYRMSELTDIEWPATIRTLPVGRMDAMRRTVTHLISVKGGRGPEFGSDELYEKGRQQFLANWRYWFESTDTGHCFVHYAQNQSAEARAIWHLPHLDGRMMMIATKWGGQLLRVIGEWSSQGAHLVRLDGAKPGTKLHFSCRVNEGEEVDMGEVLPHVARNFLLDLLVYKASELKPYGPAMAADPGDVSGDDDDDDASAADDVE